MSQEILINCSPQEVRAAIVQNGVLQELHVERTLQRGWVGNVYLGKVVRVLPGIQAAFIDIGLERAAFLHVADVLQPRVAGPVSSADAAESADAADATANGTGTAPEPVPPRPIERQIFEGQTLLVQVMKDPLGSKGARLTTKISIAGRLMVFLPHEGGVGVSQKIPPEQRSLLRPRVQQLQQQLAQQATDAGPPHPGGYIVRTNAEDASDADLLQDMVYLRKIWDSICHQKLRQPAPALLYEDLNLMQRVLRDMADEHTSQIRIDSASRYRDVMAFARAFVPAVCDRLQHYQGERPLFDLYNIDAAIDQALARRVDLKSGGYLVIDQTEALTTIDVNTGGFVGLRNFDDTIFKTNLEAAHAIARQLRLRNLGGIIIADFIDMSRPDHRQQVLDVLRRQLRLDRIKTMVGDFSALGLVEITRKRTRESLQHMLCEPCPSCQGRGMVKTPRSVAYEILREVLREARQFQPTEFRIVAAPQVVECLEVDEAQHLAGLIGFIGKPVSLQADASLAQEQYDIVLL